jgi:hypothetical protein
MTDNDSPFTKPDPVEIEPDFEADFEAVLDGESGMFMVDEDASCLKCDHFEVCAIYSGIRPMMQDWHTDDAPDAEAPIELEKLAWICEQYDPQS